MGIFQCFLDKIFANEDYVCVYLDTILVFSDNETECTNDLDRIITFR